MSRCGLYGGLTGESSGVPDQSIKPSVASCCSCQEEEEEKIGWRLESEVSALREAAEAQHRQMQVGSMHGDDIT